MKFFLNLLLLALAFSFGVQSAMAQEWPINSVATSSAIWPNTNLKDGNPITVWSSDGHGDAIHAEWLAYWFDGFHPVNFIKLYPRFVNGKALGFPTDFNVYWSDGSTWNLAKSYTNIATPQNADYVIFSLPATVTANGIQVVANKLGADDFSNYYFQIAEVGAGIDRLAIDYFGKPLPGDPRIKSINSVPNTVTIGNVEAKLYRVAIPYGDPANEGTPEKLKTYGGVTRECLTINPVKSGQKWSCFSTLPDLAAPLLKGPEIDAICGYWAPPAVVVACNESQCVSEFFMQACETRYPGLSTSTSYNTESTDENFGGYISAPEELPKQGFSSKYDATANLNTAMEILRQGRTPVIALGALLFDREGIALPCTNAPKPKEPTFPCADKLDAAIAMYPQLFGHSTFISVMDEPFNPANGATSDKRRAEIDSLKNGIALVRAKLPAAKIGFIVAPLPNVMDSVKEVIDDGQLQWIAMDSYMTRFDDPDTPVKIAKDFAEFMGSSKYANMEKWLVVQGFAPPFLKVSTDCAPCPLCTPLTSPGTCPAVPPEYWNEGTGKDLKEKFKQFMEKMGEVAKSYTGVIVWGWNSVSELDDAFAGKYFPDDIKQIYQKPICSSITFTPGIIPSSGGLASAQVKCTEGVLSYTWTVDGTVYPGNFSSNSTLVSPNTSALSKRYNVCVTANNIGGPSQPVCASLAQAAAVQSPLPSAPLIGTAVVGKGSASVSFAPGDMGSGTFVNYTAACGGTFASGTSSPILVTGLAQGTTYFCHVKTTTSQGTSSWSEWSNPVTPLLPAAPVCSSVSLSNESISAEGGLVSAQANCVGSDLSYVWTVNGAMFSGNLSTNSSSVGLNKTASPINYVVCVSASNAGGQSQAICKTLTQAAAVVPVCSSVTLSPTSVPASGGLVSAQANCSGNGLTYVWRVNGEVYPGNLPMNSSTVGASATTSPTTYSVCVTASSNLGLGQSQPVCTSLIQAGATAVPPSAPVIGNAVVVGDGAARVSFTPSALGSGAFINYTAACSGTFASGTNSPIVVTGLLKGSAYFCHVKVTTSAGTSGWSEWSNPVFP